jgi:8-oxo-dGTP pyrophosphatase MutT (NUDIX family)
MVDHENPWQILSGSDLYENNWIRLREHHVINPAGGKGIYSTVHFKNKAIGIIPIDAENNTWLVGQYRFPLNDYSWEIPMGGGPIGAPLLESAARELKEETGLTAQKWTQIVRIHTSNSVTDEEGFVYLAKDLTAGDTDFDETEQLELWKLPLDEAVQMVIDGKITDSLSMVGLLKLDWLLKNQSKAK